VQINASVSSQYISALMMIAPMLNNGLEIELMGKIISIPYIKLTMELMKKYGVNISFNENKISIQPLSVIKSETLPNIVEGDWSNASYWYNAVALSKQSSVTIFGLQQNSLQGDCILPHIYSFFGVSTKFIENGVVLSKVNFATEFFVFDFINNPDLAQTVALTCAGLKIPCILNGLETLNLKETNRIEALANELTLCGVKCIAKTDSLQLFEYNFDGNLRHIKTYKDHRMAMSFLPMCSIMPINIDDASVVEKSYPNFYNDASTIGYRLKIES
jgi:3-phosphoshikimate 1-carboxyvinyltransferase